MIFVTIGTQDKQFTRLIEAIEMNVKSGAINDEVIVQVGHTKYTSDVIKILEYIPFTEFNDYLNRADVVITHGGVGSILSAIKLGKKVVSVARLKKYKEHVNDHQLQIVEKMSKEGYIIACNDLIYLAQKIEEAKSLITRTYKSNTNQFISKFKKEIEELFN